MAVEKTETYSECYALNCVPRNDMLKSQLWYLGPWPYWEIESLPPAAIFTHPQPILFICLCKPPIVIWGQRTRPLKVNKQPFRSVWDLEQLAHKFTARIGLLSIWWGWNYPGKVCRGNITWEESGWIITGNSSFSQEENEAFRMKKSHRWWCCWNSASVHWFQIETQFGVKEKKNSFIALSGKGGHSRVMP